MQSKKSSKSILPSWSLSSHLKGPNILVILASISPLLMNPESSKSMKWYSLRQARTSSSLRTAWYLCGAAGSGAGASAGGAVGLGATFGGGWPLVWSGHTSFAKRKQEKRLDGGNEVMVQTNSSKSITPSPSSLHVKSPTKGFILRSISGLLIAPLWSISM
eukprot:CAMPEP_0174311708 /NCGR_PEP_ID=MMETSP0810-20121108/3859_1 /TAXON_ID=73025 ORGANISM="Eutreptiella gymnastica-like, Strain CCMP1594" /NCGR_SAMPLE_ID=MMETSP0810 /ASSEMBLY_ACC=CAM_ASM_000659 /LENGTH=160 /DNA_ID=CAMNT_0015419969 /DNA_START=178 /DNA_END=660 /DNA_ORIENTATION=-